MQKIRAILRFFALLSFTLASFTCLSGFVILSGPEKARLDATPAAPDVSFYWNGSAPELKDLDKLEDGRWTGLTDELAMEQLILLALDRWNDIPGSYLNLIMVTDPSAGANADDKRHTIVVKSDGNATTAAFAFPQTKEGKITDCDITISDRPTSAKSLAYTLIHELGHCIGLGHAHTNYGAIMGYARSGATLSLGADDMAGAIYLYPSPDEEDQMARELVNCATLVSGGANPRPPGPLALVLVLAPLALALGGVGRSSPRARAGRA